MTRAVRLFIVKLLCLGSFIGGPLYLCDLVKAKWPEHSDAAFVLVFLPLGIMFLAELNFTPGDSPLVRRVSAYAGLVGTLLFFIEDAFTAVEFAQGAHHPNHTMILLGLIVGVVTLLLFVPLALAQLRDTAPPPKPPW